jgi:hypothetical protein
MTGRQASPGLSTPHARCASDRRRWPRNTLPSDATLRAGLMSAPVKNLLDESKILRGEGDGAALTTRQTPTAGRSRSSSPVAARGAPKAQGLMNGSAQLIMRPCL